MRAKAFPAVAAAVVLLCGCDGLGTEAPAEPVGEHVIDPATGETRITINGKDGPATLRDGPAVPVKLPPGFTLPPGARVTRVSYAARPGKAGELIAFQTETPATEVVAHVRAEALAAGFAITVDLVTAEALTLIAERQTDGATIMVDVPKGVPTTGQLLIVPPKG